MHFALRYYIPTSEKTLTLKGYKVKHSEIKNISFADDMAVVVTTEQSIENLFKTLKYMKRQQMPKLILIKLRHYG